MAKVLITEQILQDTADAIRSKTHLTAKMKPIQFAENISSIQEGANLDDYFTYNLYSGDDIGSGAERLIKKLPSNVTLSGTSANYLFSKCMGLLEVPPLDFTGVTNFNYAFYNCSSLTSIPLIDFSSVTTARYCFATCSSLITIPLLNTQNLLDYTNMFTNCSNLSNESLNNILAMITNCASVGKNLKSAGLTRAQTDICQTLSNYQAFVDAGGVIGY